MAEMGIQKTIKQMPQTQQLDLLPQYSSDFISFSNLQKEIDEKCLRPNQLGTKVDEVAEILEDFDNHNQSQLIDA